MRLSWIPAILRTATRAFDATGLLTLDTPEGMEVEMDNFGYNWHGEMMVSYRMAEVERETEKIQLLMDAGLFNPGLLDRVAMAIEKHLVRIGLRIRRNSTEKQRAYQVTTCKYAA
jgi:hypothetical protein